MYKLLIILTLISPRINAITTDELVALQESIREMCVLPDRTIDYLQVEGNAKVSSPDVFKIVKGNLSGKVSYKTLKGISITLDKYKTDPRQCAIKMMEQLLPNFESSLPKKVSAAKIDATAFRLGYQAMLAAADTSSKKTD